MKNHIILPEDLLGLYLHFYVISFTGRLKTNRRCNKLHKHIKVITVIEATLIKLDSDLLKPSFSAAFF